MSVCGVCGGWGCQQTEEGIMEYTGNVTMGRLEPHSVGGVNQLWRNGKCS